MKKIALSLVALAALSSASFADKADSNQSSSKGYIDRQFEMTGASSSSVTEVAPLAVENRAGETAYERMLRLSAESELGDR